MKFPHLYILALLGEDYKAIKEQALTFGPSISTICIPILILDDDALESTENITLFLSPSLEDISVVSFSVQQASVEILEDSIDGMKLHLMCVISLQIQASDSQGTVL